MIVQNIIKEKYGDIVISRTDKGTVIRLYNNSIDKPKKVTIFNHGALSKGNTNVLIYSSDDDNENLYNFIRFDELIIFKD